MPSVAVDLSADVGEGYGRYRVGNDSALLQIVTSANVACGFHAGDPDVMDSTVASCVRLGVAVGAHPGFLDVRGFGRRLIEMSSAEVRTEMLYQLGALRAFAEAHKTTISHVTPHGKLGNISVVSETYADGILRAIEDFDGTLPVVTQEGELARIARQRGIPVAITAMADRGYQADGSLAARDAAGGVITDSAAIVERTLKMVIEGRVNTVAGYEIDIQCHTILVHGDAPDAINTARSLRQALLENGVQLARIGDVLRNRR